MHTFSSAIFVVILVLIVAIEGFLIDICIEVTDQIKACIQFCTVSIAQITVVIWIDVGTVSEYAAIEQVAGVVTGILTLT